MDYGLSTESEVQVVKLTPKLSPRRLLKVKKYWQIAMLRNQQNQRPVAKTQRMESDPKVGELACRWAGDTCHSWSRDTRNQG